MTGWVRLWHDMPTDPKWRVIARTSGQPLTAVLSTFTMLMVEASRAADRGSIAGWRHEDAAAALDMDEPDVAAIIDAMQGRVIIDGRLSGWQRRQPKREDDSSARVREHRENKKRAREEGKRAVTHGNAPDTDSETDNSEADASGAAAPPAPPVPNPADLRAAVFASGVPLLTSTGIPDRNARSLLGRWRQKYGDGAVLDALSAAQHETPSDPVAWITKTLDARNGQRNHDRRSEPRDPLLRRPPSDDDS